MRLASFLFALLLPTLGTQAGKTITYGVDGIKARLARDPDGTILMVRP